MPFQKVQPEKLSTSVVRQIEQLILRGILSPGERLPAERELAERLGVSRPSLREAIGELQERLETALFADFAAKKAAVPFKHVLVNKLIVQ